MLSPTASQYWQAWSGLAQVPPGFGTLSYQVAELGPKTPRHWKRIGHPFSSTYAQSSDTSLQVPTETGGAEGHADAPDPASFTEGCTSTRVAAEHPQQARSDAASATRERSRGTRLHD